MLAAPIRRLVGPLDGARFHLLARAVAAGHGRLSPPLASNLHSCPASQAPAELDGDGAHIPYAVVAQVKSRTAVVDQGACPWAHEAGVGDVVQVAVVGFCDLDGDVEGSRLLVRDGEDRRPVVGGLDVDRDGSLPERGLRVVRDGVFGEESLPVVVGQQCVEGEGPRAVHVDRWRRLGLPEEVPERALDRLAGGADYDGGRAEDAVDGLHGGVDVALPHQGLDADAEPLVAVEAIGGRAAVVSALAPGELGQGGPYAAAHVVRAHLAAVGALGVHEGLAGACLSSQDRGVTALACEAVPSAPEESGEARLLAVHGGALRWADEHAAENGAAAARAQAGQGAVAAAERRHDVGPAGVVGPAGGAPGVEDLPQRASLRVADEGPPHAPAQSGAAAAASATARACEGSQDARAEGALAEASAASATARACEGSQDALAEGAPAEAPAGVPHARRPGVVVVVVGEQLPWVAAGPCASRHRAARQLARLGQQGDILPRRANVERPAHLGWDVVPDLSSGRRGLLVGSQPA